MQLFGLIIILCLAITYILAFWVRRMPSTYAEDFARPISGRDRLSMPAHFDKRALARVHTPLSARRT
jgi:hypothetical protein